jgi:hypothetical protein
MKQQTAVEWLWNLSQTKEIQASDFQQALAMEKEQQYSGSNYDPWDEVIDQLGDTNEMIDHIGDANKMVEDDVWNVGLGDELNKLPYTKHLDDGQYNDGVLVGYELGATWGYNKAKETLYTKEQVQKMIDDALINYEIGWADRKKQFSLYEHKETITSADTPISKTFLESIPKQETLYTEEQVREAIRMAQTRKYNSHFYNADEIIQSLKQPKQ